MGDNRSKRECRVHSAEISDLALLGETFTPLHKKNNKCRRESPDTNLYKNMTRHRQNIYISLSHQFTFMVISYYVSPFFFAEQRLGRLYNTCLFALNFSALPLKFSSGNFFIKVDSL